MPIAVLAKSLSVLEALSAAERPLPLAELTAPLGMPKPTVYRILKTLLDLGYVGQEERTGFYFVTSRLANLGHPNPYRAIQWLARPRMEELHRRFNETVNLGVLEGLRVRYVEVLETTQPLRHVVTPRSQDFFYSTAIGRALVAFLPEEEMDRLIARVAMKSLTRNTITRVDDLKAELKATQKRGWSQEDGENDLGVVCFGVPLMTDGRPAAALSVSLPKSRLTPVLKKELTLALSGISRAILVQA